MLEDTVLIVDLLEKCLIALHHLDRKVSSLMFDKEAKAEKEELALLKAIDAKCDTILAALNPPAPIPTPTPPPVPVPPPTTTGTVAWVNTDPAVSDADVATWVAGLDIQVADIRALWPHVAEWGHVFVPSGQTAPTGAISATIKPTLPEAPGALAYHSVDAAGQPFIVVGSHTCIQASVSISSAMSHEATELTVDPGCQATATAPNGDVWALEVGDPVESDSYSVTTTDGKTVQMSDFVGAAFFGLGTGPLDHTGTATAAFTIAAGGYAVINGQAVQGEHFPPARQASIDALGTMGTPRRPTG